MASTSNKPPPPPPLSSTQTTTSNSLSGIHQDILRAHVLTRLDGPTLVSAACTSTELNSLATDDDLWTNVCRATWPSTDSPLVRHVISNFPKGARSFFSHSFPLLLSNINDVTTAAATLNHDRPFQLISAVDFFYREELIFSKVVETETVSGWFLCSPFRIDMLDPKDTCPTPIPHMDSEDRCQELMKDLTLSWILIDPVGPRAMNVSCHKPVSVHRHWLSGEVHARFAMVVAGAKGSSSDFAHCGIAVTCGGGGGARGLRMCLREVSLQVEDMDGMFLNGKDSLGIFHRGFEGRKGISGRKELEGKKRYEDFLEMKRQRKERKMRTEGTLDMLRVAFGVLMVASLGLFAFLR